MSATPRPWTIAYPTAKYPSLPLQVSAKNRQLIHRQDHPDELEIATWLDIIRAVNTFDEAKAALAACVADLQSHVPGATTTIHDAKAVLAKMEVLE